MMAVTICHLYQCIGKGLPHVVARQDAWAGTGYQHVKIEAVFRVVSVIRLTKGS